MMSLKSQSRSPMKKAFTLIELLVVISIIALLLSILMPALSTVKERARFIVCKSNLHNYGLTGIMYSADYDSKMPYPWQSVYSEFQFPGETQRFCRWHNEDYDLGKYPEFGGPLWPYMASEGVNLCPTFKGLSKSRGSGHPSHVSSIPIVPQFGYSMNGFLGIDPNPTPRDYYVSSISKIKRPADVFFFAEENMWANQYTNTVLNDNALISMWNNNNPDTEVFVDAFATFHKATDAELNNGVSNAVMTDGHVQQVEVKDTHKLAWPL